MERAHNFVNDSCQLNNDILNRIFSQTIKKIYIQLCDQLEEEIGYKTDFELHGCVITFLKDEQL
jgi:hypothetical protein